MPAGLQLELGLLCRPLQHPGLVSGSPIPPLLVRRVHEALLSSIIDGRGAWRNGGGAAGGGALAAHVLASAPLYL